MKILNMIFIYLFIFIYIYLFIWLKGKRSCPGEALGISELFLYLSALLQRYNVKPNPDVDPESCLEEQYGLLMKLKNTPKLSFQLRN